MLSTSEHLKVERNMGETNQENVETLNEKTLISLQKPKETMEAEYLGHDLPIFGN